GRVGSWPQLHPPSLRARHLERSSDREVSLGERNNDPWDAALSDSLYNSSSPAIPTPRAPRLRLLARRFRQVACAFRSARLETTPQVDQMLPADVRCHPVRQSAERDETAGTCRRWSRECPSPEHSRFHRSLDPNKAGHWPYAFPALQTSA